MKRGVGIPRMGQDGRSLFLQRRKCKERFWESLNGFGWLSMKKMGLNMKRGSGYPRGN